MPGSLAGWEAKHRESADKPSAEPASFVMELLPLLPRGPALDLACGTGRHTLPLASGWTRFRDFPAPETGGTFHTQWARHGGARTQP